jgi:hypothetical protein
MIYSTDPNVLNSPYIAWDNLIATGTLTATSSAAGFPVTGLLNGYTTDPWRPSAMPATVTLTLPVPVPVSCVAFAGHDMHSRGVQVQVQQFRGGDWAQVALVTPESDAPFIVSFNAGDGSVRVIFSGANTFRLAVMHVSAGLVFPSQSRIVPPHAPLNRVSEVELIGGAEGSTGEFLQADTMRTGGKASIAFSVQSQGFIKSAEFERFRQHFNSGRPFFLACFPRFDPADMAYVWNNGKSIITPYQDAVFMALDMEVGVYVG